MRKVFSLLLVLLLVLIYAAPVALATATFSDPPDQPETVPATPEAIEPQPIITYTTGADPPPAAVDLTPLLQAVISLCASLVTAFLIPWIKAKYSAEQRQKIAATYNTLVFAAEQMFGAGAGEKKLQWVTDQLAARGFTVDTPTIEAEVAKLKGVVQFANTINVTSSDT